MPDIEAGQTTDTAPEPFVTLGEGDEPLAPENEETAETEATAEAADGEATETVAAAEEETPEAPSAESLGLDLKNPKDKAAYGELVKKWGQWTNKFHAKHSQKPAEAQVQQPAQAQEQPAAAQASDADDPVAEVYKVDALENWQPTFREGSDLAEYAPELKDIVIQGIKEAAKIIYGNDKVFRERMGQAERMSKAQTVIEQYAAEIKDHPELNEKQTELQQLANRYRQVAIDDPELFVEIVERKTGLERGWRGAVEAEQEQTGRTNQRIASKLRNAVQRPTRATPLARAPEGTMAFDDAVDRALKQAGR